MKTSLKSRKYNADDIVTIAEAIERLGENAPSPGALHQAANRGSLTKLPNQEDKKCRFRWGDIYDRYHPDGCNKRRPQGSAGSKSTAPPDCAPPVASVDPPVPDGSIISHQGHADAPGVDAVIDKPEIDTATVDTPGDMLPLDTDDADSKDFKRLDNIVRHSVESFKECGMALQEIHDRKLWKVGHHDTWEAYCRQVVGMSKPHAHRMMQSSRTAIGLAKSLPIGNDSAPILPVCESQVRPLTRLNDQKKGFLVIFGGNSCGNRQRCQTDAHDEHRILPTHSRIGIPLEC